MDVEMTKLGSVHTKFDLPLLVVTQSLESHQRLLLLGNERPGFSVGEEVSG